MANSYYNNATNIIVDGTSADAADVENKCDDIAAAFDTVEVDMDKRLSLSASDYNSRELNTTLALRANKLLGFDSIGNPEVVEWSASVLPDGSINDSITSSTTTWSSEKLSPLLDPVASTQTYTALNNNYLSKIASITLSSLDNYVRLQLKGYAQGGDLEDESSSIGNLYLKQVAAFGSDPVIQASQQQESKHRNISFFYKIVQNTPTTIVDIYVSYRADDGFVEIFKDYEDSDGDFITWYSSETPVTSPASTVRWEDSLGSGTAYETCLFNGWEANATSEKSGIVIRPSPIDGDVSNMQSHIEFWSSFYNHSTDKSPRRTADIVAGYGDDGGTGVWGNEFLSFKVGASNDSDIETEEKLLLAFRHATLNQPMATNAHKEYTSGSSLTLDMDTYSTFDINVTGGIVINNPTIDMSGAWQGIRTGYMIIRSSVTSVSWGTAWKFQNNIKPTGGVQYFVFFTTHNPSYVLASIFEL